MTPFSLEVAQLYTREAVQKLVRCDLDEGALKQEFRDLAKVIAQAYRSRPDWVPAGGRALRAVEH